MTAVEELNGLRTAYVLARAERDQADSEGAGITAERWEMRMSEYALGIAEMVADADLDLLAGAR